MVETKIAELPDVNVTVPQLVHPKMSTDDPSVLQCALQVDEGQENEFAELNGVLLEDSSAANVDKSTYNEETRELLRERKKLCVAPSTWKHVIDFIIFCRYLSFSC